MGKRRKSNYDQHKKIRNRSEAQYDYLPNLLEDIAAAGLRSREEHTMTSLGEVVNNAMQIIEKQSEQLTGVLPKRYTDFSDEILSELLRIFNNSARDRLLL